MNFKTVFTYVFLNSLVNSLSLKSSTAETRAAHTASLVMITAAQGGRARAQVPSSVNTTLILSGPCTPDSSFHVFRCICMLASKKALHIPAKHASNGNCHFRKVLCRECLSNANLKSSTAISFTVLGTQFCFCLVHPSSVLALFVKLTAM